MSICRGRYETGRNRTEEPWMIVIGLMILPRDLLIFLPFSSRTMPCVMSDAYGLTASSPGARDPIAVNSWLWNHPRCWSEPSRHKSASNFLPPPPPADERSRPTPISSSIDHDVPLSNHTSIVSRPFSQVSAADFPCSKSSGGTNSSMGDSHQSRSLFSRALMI